MIRTSTPTGYCLRCSPVWGEWTVHPMMFRSRCECSGAPHRCPNEPGGGLDPNDYASFLGLRPEQVLPRDQQDGPLGWRTLVNDVQCCEYLFLDPDTGIDTEGGRGRQKHIRGTDLATIARQEGRRLVLVFEAFIHARRIFRWMPFLMMKLGFSVTFASN